MRRVVYCTVPEARHVVLFRFIVLPKRYWYDRNVQPVIDDMIDLVPKNERVHDKVTQSWSVPLSYWPAVKKLLQLHGFEVEQDVPWCHSSRNWLWDVSDLSGYLLLWLGVMQVAEISHHFFGTDRLGASNRLFMFIGFLIIGTFSFALRNRKEAFVLFVFALTLGPFHAAYLSEWWEWQSLVWAGIVFAAVCVIRNYTASERERELSNWPWRIISKI